jgi:hypothetical protein
MMTISSSSVYTHFSCFCNFFTLNQFNNVANNMGKLLDLVLSNNNNNNNRLVPTKGALSQREALDTIDPQTGSADVLPWNKFRIQQV